MPPPRTFPPRRTVPAICGAPEGPRSAVRQAPPGSPAVNPVPALPTDSVAVGRAWLNEQQAAEYLLRIRCMRERVPKRAARMAPARRAELERRLRAKEAGAEDWARVSRDLFVKVTGARLAAGGCA
jgi:hypothetical protein